MSRRRKTTKDTDNVENEVDLQEQEEIEETSDEEENLVETNDGGVEDEIKQPPAETQKKDAEIKVEPEPVSVEPPAVVVQEVVTKEQQETANELTDEQIADMLGLPKVYDTFGNRVIPSTPALKMMLERQEKTYLEKAFDNSKADIEKLVVSLASESALENTIVQHVVSLFSEYLEQMSPKFTIDETSGGKLQTRLATLYDHVLNADSSVSQVCLNVIVEIIRKNLGGAFSENYALRFANTMSTNKDQQLRFHAITTVLLAIANGTSKRNLAKTIDVRKLLDYIPDRQAKANMSEFIS